MQEVLLSESPLAHAVVPKFGLSNIDLSFIFCSGSVAPHIRSVGCWFNVEGKCATAA